jgi:hypothetical protein
VADELLRLEMGDVMSEPTAKATRLLERTLAFLSAPPPPAVLRAYYQLGIKPTLLAEVLDVDRREVSAWHRGQCDIPDEHRVMMLAYLSALLVWLSGAEQHGVAPASPFWRQRTQVARRLLDIELRESPALAHQVHALADQIDGLVRHEAMRVAAQHHTHAHRTLHDRPRRPKWRAPQAARREVML